MALGCPKQSRPPPPPPSPPSPPHIFDSQNFFRFLPPQLSSSSFLSFSFCVPTFHTKNNGKVRVPKKCFFGDMPNPEDFPFLFFHSFIFIFILGEGGGEGGDGGRGEEGGEIGEKGMQG